MNSPLRPSDDNENHLDGEKHSMISTGTPTATTDRVGDLPEVADNVVLDLTELFSMLSDKTRLRILFYLSRTPELHVRALCDLLDQSQPAVSHHLALMRSAKLIALRREGKHNFYRLLPSRFAQSLELLFAGVAVEERRIRLEDYVLSYAPGEA